MMKFGLFFFMVVISVVSEARDLRIVYKNNLGVVRARMQKNQEALDQFIGLTAKDPSDLILQFNMASSLHALGEMEKAIKLNTAILRQVEEQLKAAEDDDEKSELLQIKFATLFNRGVEHQMMENRDLALQSYQEALVIQPESKEIKTNIEMMFSGGGGKGKGKGKDKQKGDKSEGDDQSEGEGDQNEEQKDGDGQKQDKQKDQQQQNKGQPKEFDQKYMSNEDLKRIMEELKDQEQKIRAKMERKGGKSGNGNKEKEW